MALIESDWSEVYYDKKYLVKLAVAKKSHKLESLLNGFTVNLPIISWSVSDAGLLQHQDEAQIAKKTIEELLSNCKTPLTLQECWKSLVQGDLQEGAIRLVRADRPFASWWLTTLDFENLKMNVGVGGGSYLDVRQGGSAPIENRIFDIAYLVDSQTTGANHLVVRSVQLLFDEENVGQDYLKKVFASYNHWQASVLAVVQRTSMPYASQYFQGSEVKLGVGLLVLSMWARPARYPSDMNPTLPTHEWSLGKLEPTLCRFH